jgi:hypothetical protein
VSAGLPLIANLAGSNGLRGGWSLDLNFIWSFGGMDILTDASPMYNRTRILVYPQKTIRQETSLSPELKPVSLNGSA